jgi:nicotinamide-nucleotide amidase
VAESCTGGRLSDRLTNIPGSSSFFIGSIIAYRNTVKTKLLGVSPILIKRYGAVSAPVAAQMASGIRKRFKTSYGIAITGIAGPSGGSATKPVGLTYIAASSGKKTVSREYRFSGTRTGIKNQAATKALLLLKELLD